MNSTTEPLDTFLDGVEQELQNEETPPTVVYGPEWAQDKGAEEPPGEMENPVWAPSTGWMEKDSAPIHEDRPGEPLSMYAPDSMGETAPSESG